MSVKTVSKTENKKGKNLAIIITIVLCVVVMFILLFVFFFADMITGYRKISEVREKITVCDEILISDPLYDGGVLPGAGEVLVSDDETVAIAEEFIKVTDKLSYEKVLSGSTGFWDISLDFTVDGERYVVYLRNDGVYVAKTNGYLFSIKSQNKDAYADFYEKVNELIKENTN